MRQSRRATRVPTSIDVKWGFEELCPYKGTIINLTVLGCGVYNGEGIEVQPGRTIFIRFWMPAESILKVEVVHATVAATQVFGAKFLDLTEDERDTIKKMVQLFGEPHRAPPKIKEK